MNLQQFKNSATVTDFNSNNGWGFGGSFGKIYKLGDMTFKNLKFSYRHTGTSPNVSYWVGAKEVTKEGFEEVLLTLNVN